MGVEDAESDSSMTTEEMVERMALGDDEVLSRMRRGYTRDQYIRLIDKIRETVPNVSLATDVIVGFCGETEQQFEKTLDFLVFL